MLSKKHRLAKNNDVKGAISRGRSFFNLFFTVKFLKKEKGVRFTVIISTKVFKRAVKRNRLKRIIREYVRANLNKFIPGDYAIIVKPKVVKEDEKVLMEQFEKLLKNSRLLI